MLTNDRYLLLFQIPSLLTIFDCLFILFYFLVRVRTKKGKKRREFFLLQTYFKEKAKVNVINYISHTYSNSLYFIMIIYDLIKTLFGIFF